MSEFVESVKAVSAFMRENAERQKEAGRPEKANSLEEYAKSLDGAASHIIRLEGLTSALPPDLGNIHDLPQELLNELSVSKTDEIEDQIVTVINAYGGEASLDQILVGLYRKFRVTQKRRFMQNKLYRMSMVWSVSGRKGIYTTTEPTEPNIDDEIEALIGTVPQQEDTDDSEIPF